jgi:hypothetical protein
MGTAAFGMERRIETLACVHVEPIPGRPSHCTSIVSPRETSIEESLLPHVCWVLDPCDAAGVQRATRSLWDLAWQGRPHHPNALQYVACGRRWGRECVEDSQSRLQDVSCTAILSLEEV